MTNMQSNAASNNILRSRSALFYTLYNADANDGIDDDEDDDDIRRKERNQNLRQAANELKRKRKQAANLQAIDKLFSANILLQQNKQNSNYLLQNDNKSSQRPLVDLNLMGRGIVGDLLRPERSISNQGGGKYQPIQPIRCLFLTEPNESETIIETYLQQRYPDEFEQKNNPNKKFKAIPVPIPLTTEESKELKLLSFAFRGRPISKSVFLPLATILTNRDEALWDNLPWTEWTIDPQGRNVDYDGNPIDKKFLLGKRDAYNRMIGRDWYGRSLSFGNTAARLKYTLEDYYDEWLEERDNNISNDEAGSSAESLSSLSSSSSGNNGDDNLAFDESSLAYRILQLQVQESQSELADAERNYAMIKARHNLEESVSDEVLFNNYNEINAAVEKVSEALNRRTSAEEALEVFVTKANATDAAEAEVIKTELESTVNDFLTDLVSIQYLNPKEEMTTGDSEKKTADDDKDIDIIDSVKQRISDKVSSLPEVNPKALDEAREAAQVFINSLQYTNTSTIDTEKDGNILDDINKILNRENYNLVTSVKDTVTGFLDNIIERETRNAPPYRGAMGYAPQVDTKEEMFQKSILPYSSPYDLLLEIIEEQFRAEVVAVVLENTSLFPGTLIVEGAVVLRRKGGPPKTITMFGGETIEVMDEDPEEDFGNAGVTSGTTYIVECASEEAIGIALACGSKDMPISVERQIWSDVVLDVTLDRDAVPKIDKSNLELESVLESIPPVKEIKNSENNVRVVANGEALIGNNNNELLQNSSSQGEAEDSDDGNNSPTTPDNYEYNEEYIDSIKYVEEYDELTIPQKARMVITSGRLQDRQKLPRPRVLRTFEQNLQVQKERLRKATRTNTKPPVIKTMLSPLDELLIPMLGNEMLRLELLLRDAEECNSPLVEKYTIDIENLKQKQKEEEEKKNKSWWNRF